MCAWYACMCVRICACVVGVHLALCLRSVSVWGSMKAWSVRLKSCCYPSRHWSCVCVCVSAYTLGPQENTHTAEALHFDHLSLTHAGYYAVTPPRSNTDTPPAHTHPQGSVSVLYCTHSDLLGLICAAGSYFCFLKGQRVFLSRAVTDESGTDLSRCLCCSLCNYTLLGLGGWWVKRIPAQKSVELKVIFGMSSAEKEREK